ncbi:MAG: rod shape-determining protein RodA [Candidatus Terrybacteria bacterium]|nr:rod shape-determining protein RodA [Candidatus Terrybacteria bacterium]
MKVNKYSHYFHIDWILFFATLPLLAAGLITMRSLGMENQPTGGDYFFTRQLIWVAISFAIFFIFSLVDWRFLRKSGFLIILFLLSITSLLALLVFGKVTRGAVSWFELHFFSIEPADPIKLVLILILAKYFSRRHIEIANIRHIIISGIYMSVFAGLVFFQPDFGSAVIIFLIWLGMILVSGINKKHLLAVFLIIALLFGISWFFVFKPYQKARIVTFLHPLKDIRGAGYNAMQSMIAVGSGQIFGKGIGYGSQSRLGYLPEHQTDFIFAAFAEEWGLIGVLFLFLFYGIVIWRILKNAFVAESNFETLFGMGLAVFIAAHFIIHVGMDIGLLPITGVNLAFMSYGGSNLVTVFAGLGMLMGMRRYSRQVHPEDATAEFLGPK